MRDEKTTEAGQGETTSQEVHPRGASARGTLRHALNSKLSQWTFKVLAEKEILAVVHSGKHADPAAWCAPRDAQHGLLAGLPCVNWEKRRVWVIEATPTGFEVPYAYSKRVLYIDQDFYGVLVSDLYDQQGEFWKGYVNSFSYSQSPYQGYPAQPIEGGTYQYTDEWPFITNFGDYSENTGFPSPGMYRIVGV